MIYIISDPTLAADLINNIFFVQNLILRGYLHTQLPLVHTSGLVQAATLAEHLHTLLLESQYAPCAFPTQVEAVPHRHTPFPLSHVSGEVHALTLAVHLQTLFVESQ